MGLFSSKTIITTGTSISPLISDKPNLIRSAILRATINNWEKVPTILDAVINGYSIDPEGYYRYGETSYLEGLPSSSKLDFQFDAAAVRSVATSTYGGFPPSSEATVTWHYTTFGSLPHDALAYKYCVISLGMSKKGFGEVYGEVTNRLSDLGVNSTTEKAFALGLSSFNESTAELTIDFMKYPIATPENKEYFSYTFGTSDVVLQTVDLINTVNQVYSAYFSFNPTNPEEVPYYGYFLYDPIKGTHSILPAYVSQGLDSPYYPVGFVRRNGAFIQETDPLYASVETLFKNVRIELPTIQTALQDNPDVALIDNSFVLLALPIGANHEIKQSTTNDVILAKYLYYYFEYLYNISTVSYTEFWDSVSAGVPSLNTLRIEDSTFRTDLYWNYVELSTVGLANPNKTFEVTFTTPNLDQPRGDNFYSRDHIKATYHNQETGFAVAITVNGLFHVSGVYQGKDVLYTLGEVLNTDPENTSDGFFLPLHRATMNRLSKKEYTYVAFSSLILLNYSVQKTKVKWYQKASFLKLIKIVAFIVSITTMNPSLTTAVTQLATQIAIVVLESILIDLVVSPLIGFALKEIANIVGGEFAEIVAILSIALAASYGAQSFNLPFADTFLKTTTTLTGIQQKEIAEDFKELGEDIAAYRAEYDRLLEELEEAKSTFTERGLNALWFYGQGGTLQTESAQDFYTRSLSVNTDTSIAAISGYYDYKLTI